MNVVLPGHDIYVAKYKTLWDVILSNRIDLDKKHNIASGRKCQQCNHKHTLLIEFCDKNIV